MAEQLRLPLGPPQVGKDWSFQACSRPLRLAGAIVHSATGEIRDIEFERRCGTRRAHDCEGCSQVWKGDAFHALMAAANGHTGSLTFITLTAPGWERFGHTHTASHSGQAKERCHCRRYHSPEDPIVGLPVDTEAFDYDAVAGFNAAAPRLTALTMQKVWRLLGDKFPTARVMEWQARGVLHAHVIVLGHVPADVVEAAVLGRAKVGRTRAVNPSSHKGWTWGKQLDVKHIDARGGRELVNYVCKVVDYAIKDVTNHLPDTGASSALKRFIGLHQDRLAKAGERAVSCACNRLDCRNGWTVSYRNGTWVELQAAKTERACRRHARARNQYGFTGNVLSMNRSWGSSLKQAAERRRDYIRDLLGKKEPSPWVSLGYRLVRGPQAALAACLEPVKKLVTQSPRTAAEGSGPSAGEAGAEGQLPLWPDSEPSGSASD